MAKTVAAIAMSTALILYTRKVSRDKSFVISWIKKAFIVACCISEKF